MRLDSLIAALTDEAADGDEYPVGGAVAGVVAALAASLAAEAAGGSEAEWSEAAGAQAQAQALRGRAAALAHRGAATYASARQALLERHDEASPAPTDDDEERDQRLGDAIEQAAEPPLELAASAAEIAELARVIAASGSADVRADAMIAAVLAAAAAQVAARLVEINLVVGAMPHVTARARRSAEAAAAAAAAAVKVTG